MIGYSTTGQLLHVRTQVVDNKKAAESRFFIMYPLPLIAYSIF
jgi:hypothetical protein